MVDLRTTAETKIVDTEAKAKSWLSRNSYPFLIGGGSTILMIWVLHLIKVL